MELAAKVFSACAGPTGATRPVSHGVLLSVSPAVDEKPRMLGDGTGMDNLILAWVATQHD